MGTEIIGVRRLYDALGCSVTDERHIQLNAALDGRKNVSVYIGKNPPLGILQLESEMYGIPGKQIQMLHTNNEYKSDCFLEIVVSAEHDVDAKFSNRIQKKDKEAREELLDVVRKQTDLFGKIIDAVSGIIGLKFHRQLVLKPLIENPIILSGPETVSSFTGPWLEMLEAIGFNENTPGALDKYLKALELVEEDRLAKGGSILHWLTKAWRERDPVAKFIYLFIPLEGILQSDTEIPNEAHNNIEKLVQIVSESDNDDKDILLSFLEMTKNKYGPNLSARFEEFARKSEIPGWETDVKAFKKYNRMRNLLVHAGRRDIRTHINLQEETRTLEDLVERYLSVALLGSYDVYQSRWRPARHKNA